MWNNFKETPDHFTCDWDDTDKRMGYDRYCHHARVYSTKKNRTGCTWSKKILEPILSLADFEKLSARFALDEMGNIEFVPIPSIEFVKKDFEKLLKILTDFDQMTGKGLEEDELYLIDMLQNHIK